MNKVTKGEIITVEIIPIGAIFLKKYRETGAVDNWVLIDAESGFDKQGGK